jgi:quercetin dioxygenase-like cupin family protein
MTMETIDRRSAMLLGAALLAPVVGSERTAHAAMYAKDAGKEIMPGVRQVDLGKWPANLPNYKSIVITDYVVAPGSGFPPEKMKNDMICHILEGEFAAKKDGKAFTAKAGDAFVCVTGESEEDTNTGQVDAVMRVIDLMTS